MAILDLYVQTTGNNRNAGTTTADAASVTSTNGDWGNAAANRFTAASGTPFSGVSVGEWVSISLDAASAAVFIAQITVVDAGGTYIEVSTTERYGTAPTTGATGRSARVGGAWANLIAHSNTVAVSHSTPTNNVRTNVKAGTYTYTTTIIALGSGLSTGLFGLVRGYKTTLGDLDGMPTALMVPGTDCPHHVFTTGRTTTFSREWRCWSQSFLVTGATANPVMSPAGGSCYNCFIEHQNANAGSTAMTQNGGNAFTLFGCWLKCDALADVLVTNSSHSIYGNVFVGGKIGINAAVGACQFIRNLFVNQASDCINISAALTNNAVVQLHQNTFYNPSGHGVNLSNASSAIAGKVVLINNLFHTITQTGKYGVTTGTASAPSLFMHSNAKYNVTNGMLDNFGDSANQEIDTYSFSNDPFTNPGSGDFSFKTAEALRNGFPYLLPGYSTRTYLERGMIQAASAGGLLQSGGMTGGFNVGGHP